MADTATVAIDTPGWVDLQSSDAKGSRKFYTELFDWSVDVIADPEAGGYGMFKLDGKEVGGVGPGAEPWPAYGLAALHPG
jgi:predicted enzyme related to lactoylglutathione lyase